MHLKNKVAIVTGGSSGIGASIVNELVNEGCSVVFTYNSKEADAKSIEDKLGGKAKSYKIDLKSESEIRNLFEFTKRNFGQLDILVNNAGVNRPRDLFDTEVWKLVFQINLFSAVTCSRHAAEMMKDAGRILNITSIYGDGKVCAKELAAYGASKAALNHFTQALAKNLAPKILVNAIAPGYVKTPLWGNKSEKEFEEAGEDQLINRMILPEEIAKIAVSIIKNDAITGEIVTVDGGLSLKTV